MRIEADIELCVGAGMCAHVAPEIFNQNSEDGRVLVLAERPSSAEAEAVREAVDLCPSGALSLVDVRE